ncbi:MAG: hypothetical protein LBQ42_05985 [Synergistaceae bacterium]|jgi:hypothetical protein|nr:hypothetical protein [Synergistaceae bacterium]
MKNQIVKKRIMKNWKLRLFALSCFAACLCSTPAAWAQDVLLLRVPFEKNAMATATLPDGRLVPLGAVRALPVKTNWPAYTASKWGVPQTVCATAVNAIHILVDVEKDRGRIFSVVPTVTVAPAAPQGAFFAIDSPAGTGIFGGFAPLTGSKVFIEGKDGAKRPLAPLSHEALSIEEGESLLIESALPDRTDAWMVDIENRPGGRVLAWTKDGPKVVARVVRPVGGVGRFGGTEFQGVGRIRASHTGVIDVATAPRGQVGGIQIMPLTHALTSSEMASAWKLTQWMIVAPLPGKGPLEGTPPLFKGLLPGSQLDDKLPDVWSTYGRKPLVLGRFDGGVWKTLPPVAGKVDDALRALTHLRIYYPFWEELQRP